MRDVFQNSACIVTLAGALVGIIGNHSGPERCRASQAPEKASVSVPPSRREDHLHGEEREPASAVDEGATMVVSQITSGNRALVEEYNWTPQRQRNEWNRPIQIYDEFGG